MIGELLLFSGILFATGLAGFLIRRNVFIVLMSLEIMLNSASVVFVAGSTRWGTPDGLASVLIIIAIAAAEAAVGLALFIALYRTIKSEKVDEWKKLKG